MIDIVIIDTNIWVSGFLFRGPPHDVLRQMRNGTVRAYVSDDLLVELAAVLTGPKLARYFRRMQVSVEELLNEARRLSVHLPVLEQPFVPALRDHDDLHVLAVAKASLQHILPAHAIVTGDQDLLVLREFEGIPIMSAAQWLTKRREQK